MHPSPPLPEYLVPWRGRGLKGKWQNFLTKGLVPLQWPFPLKEMGTFSGRRRLKARDERQMSFVGKKKSLSNGE